MVCLREVFELDVDVVLSLTIHSKAVSDTYPETRARRRFGHVTRSGARRDQTKIESTVESDDETG